MKGNNHMGEQHLLSAGKLLDEKGNLREAGYAYSLVKEYSRSEVKASKMRLKEWDYYYLGNKERGLALTIADNGYMDLCSASLLDFRQPAQKAEKMTSRLFSLGRLHLPPTSASGDVFYQNKKVKMAFVHEGTKRHLTLTWQGFSRQGDLNVDVSLEPTTEKTMVIATPFKKNRHFYYNQKINNLKGSGYARLGSETISFGQDSYGVLDWGRGVWTYQNTWYWSSLNSVQDGVPIGWNLGYGFGDTSHASENMLFVGPEVYKLSDVEFQIPKDGKGRDDYLKPWKFISKSGDIDLTFTPLLDRAGGANLLLLKSDQHQVFGRFSGTFKVNGNKEIQIKDLPGFAEKVFNRW
jgi:hypothetical protein